MKVSTGDILFRKAHGSHWLITNITSCTNDVYQLDVLELESGKWMTYTSPFGLDIPDTSFYKVA